MSQTAITPHHPLARTSTLVLSIVLAIAVLVFWRTYPEIDIAISRQFFSPKTCPEESPAGKVCGDFLLIFDEFMRGIRRVGHDIPLVMMALVGVWAIANLIGGYNPQKRFWQGPVVGLLSAFIGPLLVVNLFFKTFKGRARPFQLEMFGREKQFTLPGTFTDNCAFNCSFPSGEAAAAAWMLVLVPFLPQKWRKQALAIVLFWIISVSFLRVAFGRHFPSDVSMGVMITLTSICLSFWLTARIPNSWHRFRGTRTDQLNDKEKA